MARVPEGRRTERGVEQQGLGSRGSRQEAPGDVNIPGVQRDPGLSVNPNQFGAQVGRALQGFGQGIGDLAEVHRQITERRQKNEDSIFLARAQSRLNQSLYETSINTQNEVENPGRYFETVTPKYQQSRQEVLASLQEEFNPSQDALNRYEIMAERLVGDYGIKAITFENNQKVASYRNHLGLEVNSVAESVLANGDIEAGLASLDQTLSGFRDLLPPDEFREVAQVARAQVSSAYLEGLLRRDPAGGAIIRDYGLGGGEGTIIGAIVDVESNGNPNAVSSAGASGLMQVMPGTAAEIAREIGDESFPYKGDPAKLEKGTPEWREIQNYLKDEEIGTRYGTHYFKKMMRRYGGDVEAALVAYNGGPERADNWLRAGRDDSVIPRETSQYYKKVLARVDEGDGNALAVAFKHLPIEDQLRFVDKGERANKVRIRQFEDRLGAHIANIELFGEGLTGFDHRQGQRFLDPEQYAEVESIVAQAHQDHEAIRDIRYGSPSEALAAVRDAEPMPGSEDIERQVSRQARFEKVLQDRIKALQEDPAGYVHQGFDDVSEAYEAAFSSSDTELRERAGDLALETQRDLGVLPQNRRVLPGNMASQIVSTLRQAPTSEQAQALQAELDLWGDHRERVLSDLSRAGLPDMLYIAGLNADDPVLTQQLATLAGMEKGELTEGMAEIDVGDTRRAITEALVDYREAFTAGDFTGARIREYNKLHRAAESLALLELRNGATPEEAAESVRTRLIDRNVTVIDGGRMQAIVPTEFNADAVEAGAESMLPSVPETLDIEPFETVYEIEGFDEDLTRQSIINVGQWVYAGDGQNLALMVPMGDGSMLPVKTKDGTNVLLSFADAERVGASQVPTGQRVFGARSAQPLDVLKQLLE